MTNESERDNHVETNKKRGRPWILWQMCGLARALAVLARPTAASDRWLHRPELTSVSQTVLRNARTAFSTIRSSVDSCVAARYLTWRSQKTADDRIPGGWFELIIRLVPTAETILQDGHPFNNTRLLLDATYYEIWQVLVITNFSSYKSHLWSCDCCVLIEIDSRACKWESVISCVRDRPWTNEHRPSWIPCIAIADGKKLIGCVSTSNEGRSLSCSEQEQTSCEN